MKEAALFILTIFLFTSSVFAQESIGIGISNYSPTNSLLLNPSSIVDSKAFIDIHLVGFSVFARNDFVHFDGNQVSLTNPNSFNGAEVLYNEKRAPFRAYSDVLVQGPTVTATIGKHSFGLYTGVRSVTDVRGLGQKTADYIINGFQYGPYIGTDTRITNMRATTLAWAEAGLSYGRIIRQTGNDLLTVGVHVKRLFGIGAAAARLKEWHFTLEDSTTMQTHSISGSYGFNEPGWNSGKGWGGDIGLTYKKTKSGVSNYIPHLRAGGCETCDYQYKVSVALLDIGRLKFDPEFYASDFNEDSEYTLENFDSADPEGLDGVSTFLNDNFELQEDNQKANFRVALPAALSAQFDYNLGYNLYANASLVVGVPFKRNFGIQRAASLSLTPRYEIKRFEAALPITLHEIADPMVGFMVRLNSIIIGTDNLGPYLFNSDVYGADIYFHLKYTIFRARGCKGKTHKRGQRGGKIVPCASW
ncbi:MAG: DUF5723 family protein [Flavobacteriales bacterium]|nr:DUF5723 family protein [Flavobacteriales bacterium]